MAEYIKDKSILFLICSSGNKIDISPYLKEDSDNIAFDFRNQFASLEIVNRSSIIHLSDEKIDTIIEINSSNLNENMVSFKNMIENH